MQASELPQVIVVATTPHEVDASALDYALSSAGASRVETYLSKDQKRLLVLFEGLDEAAAREVCGNLAITAVWDGYVIRSPESDEGGEVVSVVERDFPRPLSLGDVVGAADRSASRQRDAVA